MTANLRDRADFSKLRYAQCWEDTEILLEALQSPPGSTLFSIGSGGDNTLALLATAPKHVVAVDLSPAQIAMLELRVAAHRLLDYPEMLEAMGVRQSKRRSDLYEKCRPQLSTTAKRYWDDHMADILRGATGCGRFERYLHLFGTRILPLIHAYPVRMQLLRPRPLAERETFYEEVWNTWRWRMFFRVFFSRLFMGRVGRAPAFLEYAEGDIAQRLLVRTRHALVDMDPSRNPYLQWILLGHHGPVLPFALRPENFQPIRDHLDCLTWHTLAVEEYLEDNPAMRFNGFNLSDIFEYVDAPDYQALLERFADAAEPGARLAYWNVFAPRKRPPELAHRIRSLPDVARRLHDRDQTFFYSAFVVEEVI